MPSKVINVTKENYAQRAKDFMAICQGEGGQYGEILEKGEDPGPWMAWTTYFKRRGLSKPYFEQAQEYLVPARWPHEFDSEWNPEWDGRWVNHVIPKQGFLSEKDEAYRKQVVRDALKTV